MEDPAFNWSCNTLLSSKIQFISGFLFYYQYLIDKIDYIQTWLAIDAGIVHSSAYRIYSTKLFT